MSLELSSQSLEASAHSVLSSLDRRISICSNGSICDKGPWPLSYNQGRENDMISLSLFTNATTIQTKERDNKGKGNKGKGKVG